MKELLQFFKANIALWTSISELYARVSQFTFLIRLMKTQRTFSISLFTWQDKSCEKLWSVGTSSLKKLAKFSFPSFFWKKFKDYISYGVKNLTSWIKVCWTHFLELHKIYIFLANNDLIYWITAKQTMKCHWLNSLFFFNDIYI